MNLTELGQGFVCCRDGDGLRINGHALDGLQCSQCVRSLSRDGHRLVVNGDTLNLAQLWQGFVCCRDGDGLRINGHALDGLQCTQSVSGLSRDGHRLVVDGDTINLSQLWHGFVCGRDGDGLWINGDALDTLQRFQCVAGVGRNGETLVVDGYTLDVAKGPLCFFCQLAVNGEYRLLVFWQYALCYVLDVLVFLLLLLEFCHLLTYLALTVGISGQSILQKRVDFCLYLLLFVEVSFSIAAGSGFGGR